MKSNFLSKGLALALSLLVLAGCEKNYLDINTDPNNAPDATVELLLPAAQGFLAYNLGNQFAIAGGLYAQYWTQGPAASQYKDFEQYRLNDGDFDRPFQDIYSGPLQNLAAIIRKGNEARSNPGVAQDVVQRNGNYLGIAYIMKAYTYQLLVDNFGDVPLTDANRGEAASGGILNPRYDAATAVYDSLISMIDRGLTTIDETSDFHPGKDDLIYGGDMAEWIHFANTLKLRIYLRQARSGRASLAEAGIRKLYADGAGFLGEGETGSVKFTDAQFNRNPLFQVIKQLGEGNLVASNTYIRAYQTALGDSLSDPRADVIFVPASAGGASGNLNGLDQGAGVNTFGVTQSALEFSRPSSAVGGAPSGDLTDGATAPVILLSDWESYFLQAEANVRYGVGDPAQDLFDAGVQASFDYFSLDGGADFIAGLSPLTTGEQAIEAIITQKWAAMAGTQNLEAWVETRRTNYPSFLIRSVAAIGGGTNERPARLPYANSESVRNSNYPGLKDIFLKIFWDVD